PLVMLCSTTTPVVASYHLPFVTGGGHFPLFPSMLLLTGLHVVISLTPWHRTLPISPLSTSLLETGTRILIQPRTILPPPPISLLQHGIVFNCASLPSTMPL